MSKRNRAGQSKSDRQTLHCVHTPECGKHGYVSRADAKKAQRFHRGRGMSRTVRPYECPTCGFWHLGHPPPAVKAGATSAAAHYGA